MTETFYARVDYTYQGGDRIFSVPFNYIKEEYINVLINNSVCLDWTNLSESQIQIDDNAELSIGDLVTIVRQTPIDERMVVFSDTSILNKDNQNLAQEQVFDAVQEIYDSNLKFQSDTDLKVENALSISQNALNKSENAQTVADDAISLSEEALSNSTSAKNNSDLALSNSETALSNSQTALENSADALQKANYSIEKIDEFADDIQSVISASERINELENAVDTASQAASSAESAINSINSNITDINNHMSDNSNPHNVTKAQIGLSNVDNTSDLNKPVSNACQSALDLKADKSDVEALNSAVAQNSSDISNCADIDLFNVTNYAERKMAEMTMPSDRYVDLTIGASGSSYTAIANGYYVLVGRTEDNGNQHIIHFTKNGIMWTEVTTNFGNNEVCCYCPVRKNEVVKINYGRISSFNYFRFYYAQGDLGNDSGEISGDERESLTVQNWDSI